MLVNKYGLSHVCALQEFQNIGKHSLSELPYNYPYLDIYLPITWNPRPWISTYHLDPKIEFYYRGAKDRTLKFKNLFEYLLWTADNGQG